MFNITNLMGAQGNIKASLLWFQRVDTSKGEWREQADFCGFTEEQSVAPLWLKEAEEYLCLDVNTLIKEVPLGTKIQVEFSERDRRRSSWGSEGAYCMKSDTRWNETAEKLVCVCDSVSIVLLQSCTTTSNFWCHCRVHTHFFFFFFWSMWKEVRNNIWQKCVFFSFFFFLGHLNKPGFVGLVVKGQSSWAQGNFGHTEMKKKKGQLKFGYRFVHNIFMLWSQTKNIFMSKVISSNRSVLKV